MMAPYLNQCRGVEFEFDIPTFLPTLREVLDNKFILSKLSMKH